MMPYQKRILRFEIFSQTILFVAVVAFFIFLFLQPFKNTKDVPEVNQLSFTGTWQRSIADEQKPLTEKTIFKSSETKKLILRGHFNNFIPYHDQIHFFSGGLFVTIKSGTLTACVHKANHPNIMYSQGATWCTFLSPLITPVDLIEITIENPSKYTTETAFNQLISSFCAGDKHALFLQQVHINKTKIFVDCVIMILGIVYLFTTISLRLMGIKMPYGFFSCGILLIFGAITTLLNQSYITLLFQPAYIPNTINYFIKVIIGVYLLVYLRIFLTKKPLLLTATVMINIWILLIVITTILQIAHVIHCEDAYKILLPAIILILLVMIVCLTIQNCYISKKRIKLLLTAESFLIIMTIADLINFILIRSYSAILFQLGLFVFSLAQFYVLIDYTHENMYRMQHANELENQLTRNKISLMVSQIQPHFLYNSLAAIQQLCDVDPKQAVKAIDKFALFLRGNIDSLSSTTPIPFTQELEHVNNYLFIEKLRFGERLNIEMDIPVTDFNIPPLTLQPVVENAVHYGITKREHGGTVKISTQRKHTGIAIIVQDNGIGFTKITHSDNSHSHIGLENVRARIEMQCKGTLKIETKRGQGTTVTIFIPCSPKENNK